MAHTQLGDDNILFYAGTTSGVLEVDADHLVLVSCKQLLNAVDVVIHHGRGDGVHHREIRSLAWVSTLCSPNSIGAPLDIPSLCVIMGVLVVLWGVIEKVEETKVITAAGIKGEAERPGISAGPDGSSNLQGVIPSCRT